ncbi:hypothetical protein J1605_019755 [Eschrichtius robustus]|uniref:CRIM domain-containing protein n=1 Tax=Eschrichtius robustus TaxID=9764 RepID=A0AB34HI95_ESCRO|nr:hypothetical protein J1605_019755 [Eschrichtius robustus]
MKLPRMVTGIGVGKTVSQELRPSVREENDQRKGHVGTTATKKIDVYLPLHSSQDRLLPMTVVTMASARVQDLIGLICWQYTSEGREPKLK